MAIQLGDTTPDFAAETIEVKGVHQCLGNSWGSRSPTRRISRRRAGASSVTSLIARARCVTNQLYVAQG
ncbi:MAG: hypothetical protein ACYDEY_04245 [Acidimicrobiales bacterium]